MAKLSEALQQRIEETQGEILALEARLPALLAEKQATLGAATIDPKALQRLELEETKIPASLASLRTRCTLLADQVEEALKSEASERVAEIATELEGINAGLTARYSAFLTLVDEQLKLMATDYAARQKRTELQAEARYLHEQYAAPYPGVRDVQVLSARDIGKLEAAFTKFWGIHHAGHSWQEKTDALIQQRAREERTALMGQRGRVRMVTRRPSPFEVTHSTFAE